MTVHRGTMDALNRVFSSNTLSWEPQSTGGGGGSTQVSVSSVGGVVVARSSAADALVTVYQSSYSGLLARVQNSTIGDLLASVQQNSSAWQVQAGSTNWPKAAGLSVDTSNAQNVKLDGSTVLSVQQNSSAWQVQAGSTAFIKNAGLSVDTSNALNVKLDGSTAITVQPLSGSTFNVRALNSSAADLQMTATPVAGSTWNVRALCSSAADFKNQSWNFDSTGGGLIGSTKAVNLGANGMLVRPGTVDSTTATAQAASSGEFSIMSSVAGQSIYVYAFCMCYPPTTAVLTNKFRWISGTTQVQWSGMVGGIANGVSATNGMCPLVPVHMNVTPPAYLFKTAAAANLALGITSSGLVYSVAAWKE